MYRFQCIQYNLFLVWLFMFKYDILFYSWAPGLFGGQALPWTEFLVIVSSRRHVTGLCMLYKDNSNSNRCLVSEPPRRLLPEFDISELLSQLIHLSSKCNGVGRPNLQGVSCLPTFVSGMTFPTLFVTRMFDELRKQSTLVAFMSCVISVFCGAGASGVAKAIYKQFYVSQVGLCLWF